MAFALPIPGPMPDGMTTRCNSDVTALCSICGVSSELARAHAQRCGAAKHINGSEKGLDMGVVQTYVTTWRSQVLPALLKNSTHTSEPLVFVWDGPFGHDYSEVRQSCVLYESAMLAVTLGFVHLKAGRAHADTMDFKAASKSFFSAVHEFQNVETYMNLWTDTAAIATCPPVLRRSVPTSMQLYARAWVQLTWAHKSIQLSAYPDMTTAHLLVGACEFLEQCEHALRSVHVGVWREHVSVMKAETNISLHIVLARIKQYEARELPSTISVAHALAQSALDTWSGPLGSKNAFVQECVSVLNGIVSANSRVYFQRIDVKVSVGDHVPEAQMITVPPPPDIIVKPIDTH